MGVYVERDFLCLCLGAGGRTDLSRFYISQTRGDISGLNTDRYDNPNHSTVEINMLD